MDAIIKPYGARIDYTQIDNEPEQFAGAMMDQSAWLILTEYEIYQVTGIQELNPALCSRAG